MHIALMEPTDPRAAEQVAKLCAETGTSLHLIGPVEFATDDLETQEADGQLDLWIHPDWFEFRRAIARERCYYFAPDGEKTIDESRLRPTSVLMFAGPDGLPARIKEKYPHRLYKLPGGDHTKAIKATLEAALSKVSGGGEDATSEAESGAPRSGRRPGRGRGRSR